MPGARRGPSGSGAKLRAGGVGRAVRATDGYGPRQQWHRTPGAPICGRELSRVSVSDKRSCGGRGPRRAGSPSRMIASCACFLCGRNGQELGATGDHGVDDLGFGAGWGGAVWLINGLGRIVYEIVDIRDGERLTRGEAPEPGPHI